MADTQKSILITGCSSGIGYAVAHGLQELGWRVFATCRSQDDCDRLIGEGLESYVLDYESQSSMESAVAETLNRTGGTLDALFNNGAIAIPGLLEDLPIEAMRSIFETNFFAQHELTRLVIPAMRQQGHGRILMNSSILGFAALAWRGAYNSTKFAMEGWADTLRLEMHGSGIHIVLIEPGPVTSELRKKSAPHFEKWISPDKSARTQDYNDKMMPRLYAPAGKPDPFELPAEACTKVIYQALTAASPRPRYRITTPTKVLAYVKRMVSTRMWDRLLRRA